MANRDFTIGKDSNHSPLIAALPGLLKALRQAEFQVGTEQHIAACDLLVSFTATARQPTVTELRATLASVFCTSPSEQARFPEVFEPWYRSVGGERPPAPSSSEMRVEQPTWTVVKRPDRLRVWFMAAAACVVLAGLGWYVFIPPVEPPPVSEKVTQQPPPKPPVGRSAMPQRQQLIPRQPPEPITPPATYQPWWAGWGQAAWLVAVSLWGLWVGGRLLLRHMVLTRRRQRPGEQIRLESLRLAGERGGLFSAPLLADTWRHLRQFRTMRSARLNESATIDRTLDAGGYFRPVYRDRQVPPAYLFLVDRRHAEDHVAEMAAELGAALRREQIPFAAFDYHEDPRYCRPVGEIAAERSPAALAGVYGDRTLFLVGDGDALFDSDSGKPQAWMQEFASFEQKYLLTTGPAWWQSHRADDLAQAGFQVLPLTTAGLGQLRTAREPIGWDDPRDLPLPRRFAVSSGYWLEERPLKRPVLRAAFRELKEYLGSEGFLLLCATAAYPGLYWRLTRALDAQLGLAASDRAVRLRKLGRLPWYRHGRMPNVLRGALLRSLDRSRRRRITDAYHALIEHRTDDPLRLPIAVPDWKSVRAEVRERVQASARHEPFGDRIFADVVRGRKPRLLEFGLPSWWAPPFKRQQWSGLVGPILSGLVLIPAAIWLNVWVWQAWLGPLVERQAMSRMQEQHQKVRVQVSSPVSLRPIAQALEQSLGSWGFQVESGTGNDQSQPVQRGVNAPAQFAEQASRSTQSTREPTSVVFRSEQKASALMIADRVEFLYYGLKPELVEDKSQRLKDADVLVELHGSPRGFRDELKTGPKAFRDRLRNGQDGPDMMMIPGGLFRMGDLQGGGEKDERPAREVRIRPFALARYETTFEEYDQFAQATKRSLPDDEGWGRGRRPAINVSWDDAKAYAGWVSEQTGKPYRLPTEAEWEYAARSGGKDERWAGTSDEKLLPDHAVFNTNRTEPVGGKKPNGLGLYDMSGNVWEWVEDCWHENYQGGPTDGSAWVGTGKGGCPWRVIRGGSWGSYPVFLRASNRDRDVADSRDNNIGFRLAQDNSE